MDWVREGLGIYCSRLSHYVRFEICELPEMKNVSALRPEQIKEKEGKLLLSKVRPGDEVILLDEKGRSLRSVDFAARLQEIMSRSARDMVFVVGGAYGFSKEVYDRADGMLSLSPMTFSHQMVRVLFTEQLYRAFTIIRGEPYHNE